MELKFQFNKVAMQQLQRQLKVRQTALPILKSKEAALRVMEKRLREEFAALEAEYNELVRTLQRDIKLWAEFPDDIFTLNAVHVKRSRIAGIAVPELDRIDWHLRDFSRFHEPTWVGTGALVLRDVITHVARVEVARKRIEVIQHARRKTTQKVNLYEKVQIPAFEEAIRKIKRYLEDVANLDTAVQKMTKQRAEQASEAANG